MMLFIISRFAVPMVPKQRDTPKTLTVNKKSYQILAPLGKGGSSKVYLVNTVLNKKRQVVDYFNSQVNHFCILTGIKF